MAGRQLTSDSGLIVVYLPGVMSSGAEFENVARMLRESTGAAVIRLDLRGHGLSAPTPGDIEQLLCRRGVEEVSTRRRAARSERWRACPPSDAI